MDIKFPCRFSYVHVFKPYSFDPKTQPEKYSASLIIPKDDTETVKKIKDAIQKMAEENKDKLGKGAFTSPLRDGDEERPDDPAYANSYFINSKNGRKPGIVDKYLREITDESEFYSGCYGYAHVTLWAYNTSGNRGITMFLNNVMKKEDGEPLGGVSQKAETAFADFAEDAAEDFLA